MAFADATQPDIPVTTRRGLQRIVIRTLLIAQILGGVGTAAGAAVGSLLASDLSSDKFAGFAAASSVIGAALVAIPVTRLMSETGRRPGLVLAYLIGMIGAILTVVGAQTRIFPLAILGMILVGGGTTAGLQARYVASDLAEPERRGRDISIVVWATTIGSVTGPNLADPMGSIAERIGLPYLTGSYMLTFAAFGIAAGVVWQFLRPDPLLVARDHEAVIHAADPANKPDRMSIPHAVRYVAARPETLLGFLAIVIGQTVMTSVMSMTPVHLKHADAGLKIVGLVISIHIAGMFGLSPVVGAATDRFGRRPVILLGVAIFIVSFLVSGTASGDQHRQLMIGLFLLGLGWSCTMIAGSTLLTESLAPSIRPSIQGTTDLIMGMSGAGAGLLAGVVIGLGSYAILNAAASVLVAVLLVALILERQPRMANGPT